MVLRFRYGSICTLILCMHLRVVGVDRAKIYVCVGAHWFWCVCWTFGRQPTAIHKGVDLTRVLGCCCLPLRHLWRFFHPILPSFLVVEFFSAYAQFKLCTIQRCLLSDSTLSRDSKNALLRKVNKLLISNFCVFGALRFVILDWSLR